MEDPGGPDHCSEHEGGTAMTQTTEYPLKVGRCLSPEGHAWRHPFPEFVECTRCYASILVDNRHDRQGATIVITSPVQEFPHAD